MTPVHRRVAFIGGAALWCVLVGAGIRQLFAYETTQGEETGTPARWPAESRLAHGAGTTVVMFVHPDCPCSRASLTELAALHPDPTTTIEVVFANPEEQKDPDSYAWQAAGRIPGVSRFVDEAGREAARFGALTSGYTVVYDASGERRFAGGITGSRGHVGDNVGRDAVQTLIAGNRALDSHPVFGCSLGVTP